MRSCEESYRKPQIEFVAKSLILRLHHVLTNDNGLRWVALFQFFDNRLGTGGFADSCQRQSRKQFHIPGLELGSALPRHPASLLMRCRTPPPARTFVTCRLSRSYNQAAQVPFSKVTYKFRRMD